MNWLSRKKFQFRFGILLLILCMIAVGHIGLGERREDEAKEKSGFQDSVRALEKAVVFYSKDYDKVNLDSIFGLRVCQGVLHRAILLAKRKNENSKQIEKIKRLHSSVSKVAQNGYELLKSSNSDYVRKFEFLVNDEWIFMLPYQNADSSLLMKSNDIVDELDEATSDICMTDLVGNKEEAAPISCVITNQCWSLMSAKAKGGYHLTHQALFMMLAEKQGCRSHVLEKLGTEEALTKHLKYIGSNIYHQMETKYRHGIFNDDNGKDLFVEQIVICQMLGIIDCFDSKYLKLFIQWQDESGCWKEKRSHDDEKQDSMQTGGVFKNDKDGNVLSRLSSRTLNEEKILSDGCASHFTGVATGALAMYTFWFLNPHNKQSESNTLDTFATTGRRFYGTGDQGYLTDIVFDIKWPLVFAIVSVFVYYCRKWTRKHISRRYTKLTI